MSDFIDVVSCSFHVQERIKVTASVFENFQLGITLQTNKKYVFGRITHFMNYKKEHCAVHWEKYPTAMKKYILTKELLNEFYEDAEDLIPSEKMSQMEVHN